jgi:hypothetical protein
MAEAVEEVVLDLEVTVKTVVQVVVHIMELQEVEFLVHQDKDMTAAEVRVEAVEEQEEQEEQEAVVVVVQVFHLQLLEHLLHVQEAEAA